MDPHRSWRNVWQLLLTFRLWLLSSSMRPTTAKAALPATGWTPKQSIASLTTQITHLNFSILWFLTWFSMNTRDLYISSPLFTPVVCFLLITFNLWICTSSYPGSCPSHSLCLALLWGTGTLPYLQLTDHHGKINGCLYVVYMLLWLVELVELVELISSN